MKSAAQAECHQRASLQTRADFGVQAPEITPDFWRTFGAQGGACAPKNMRVYEKSNPRKPLKINGFHKLSEVMKSENLTS